MSAERPSSGLLPRGAGFAARENLPYVEDLYERWLADPASVGETWQWFFAGFELSAADRTAEGGRDQSRVASLIYAYRDQGHRLARLDPLESGSAALPALEPDAFGLGAADLERVFDTGHLAGAPPRAPLREIIARLREIYCGTIGVEYLHIQDVRCRRWVQAQLEPARGRPSHGRERKLEILKLLVDAELFETYLASHYPGQKRFSLEGAETLIPALHALVELCPGLGVREIVIGMAHRGRLNVLANLLDKPYALVFSEFEENVIPEQYGGGGDVKYHRGFSSDHVGRDGGVVHLSLTGNPSHLEAVDPVVEGRARAKQRRHEDTVNRRTVLPLLVHGDAAFAGQGLVSETLNLSALEGYRTGGTVHFIVNNQIGFTTSPGEARSTRYCTDVAKMIEAPIFHVNGDDPEATVFVAELALRYRQEFGRDAVVDMVCYRRHGHNEGDEPAFTQPALYARIKDHPPVRQLYTRRLVEEGGLSPEVEARITLAFKDELERAYQAVKAGAPPHVQATTGTNVWDGLLAPFRHDPVETAVPRETLERVAAGLCAVPEGFRLNPKVGRALQARLAAVRRGGVVDWAFAEALAFGTLLLEGTPVRLSGQDSARGTFSQRHAVWSDTQTQAEHVPLNHLAEGQAHFCVYNSLLSEAAVLGFDYGYSLEEPRMLILWEAQFGDFANGAQVIIDQFIGPALAKWQRSSGLVMLLPHGYEGQGPEHSNAYLERYLAACAEENIQVVNASTPAQYFHLLRRQVRRDFRRPLVVMAPKSLLRHARAVSPVDELAGGRFEEILDDARPGALEARRLVLCCGKVYYDLLEALGHEAGAVRAGDPDGAGAGAARPGGATRAADALPVALVRVEQLYPLHEARLREVVARYPQAREVLWVQEEPENRGAWRFLRPRLEELLRGRSLRHVGRPASASPATGSLRQHRQEQQRLVHEALGEGAHR